MAVGWVRAYSEENSHVKTKNSSWKRAQRAEFRKKFKTLLKTKPDESSTTKRTLRWGDIVELPDGLSNSSWTLVKLNNILGFVLTRHLIQIAYAGRKNVSKSKLEFQMTLDNGKKRNLLWGDLIQITRLGTKTCDVRARGWTGKMNTKDLQGESLLEVYFCDVTQGDGVFVRTPDSRHMLIDGGFERAKQLTGKNAADFVDWKFFFDYGDYRINLESMMASHSDNDHYGGLHDLVRVNSSSVADRELDCTEVNIDVFHHPGLSRWKKIKGANPPHFQGLGQFKDGLFIQLLGDREDAENAISNKLLSGPWGRFISDILNHDDKILFEQILITEELLNSGETLPLLWPSKNGCDIRVLGPVAKKVGNTFGLPNMGQKSFNTNGHSVCLRIDYGSAKILLTGDLNVQSMDWLRKAFGDRMGSWECDVAKACHHGSPKVSYQFLEQVRAAATIISSGDSEGHGHPAPDMVAASALTGFRQIDRDKDKLITPLVFMTEIERSVTLGAINRIDFRGLPVDNDEIDGTILGRNLDELQEKAYLSPEDWKELKKIKNENQAKAFVRKKMKEAKLQLEKLEDGIENREIDVDFNITIPNGALSPESLSKNAWRSRVMNKNHYGLVNVRTDGNMIMCATLNETEKKWITYSFPARF